MAHWSDRFLGLPWREGEFDCADLCRRVQREIFGKEIRLPADHGDSAFGRSAAVSLNKLACAEPVDEPADGDAVLLQVRGRLQHVGVFCLIDGERWIMHNQQGAGVHRVRVRDLQRWGYQIESFYRWI